MKRILSLVAMLFLSPLWAYAEGSSNEFMFGAGLGQASSSAWDASLRHNFSPWLENSVVRLAPFAEASGTYLYVNSNDDMWAASVAGGLKLSILTDISSIRPYLSGSFGGSFLSEHMLSSRNLGQRFQFRSRGALGIDFGEDYRHAIEVNTSHYTNSGMDRHNASYSNIGVMYGYKF